MDLPERLREKVDEWLGRTEPAAPALKKRAKTEVAPPPPKKKSPWALGGTSVYEAEQ